MKKSIFIAIAMVLVAVVGGLSVLIFWKKTGDIKTKEISDSKIQDEVKEEKFQLLKDAEFGPYEKIESWSISNSTFGIGFVREGKYYVNINDKENGPYDIGRCLSPDDSGEVDCTFTLDVKGNNWGFNYQKDGKSFINVNDKIYGPYDGNYSSTDFVLFEGSDKFISKAKKDGKYYVIYGDTEYGPYDTVDYHNTTQDGKFIFGFEKGGKYYVNVNGKELGPFDPFGKLEFAPKEVSSSRYIFSFLRDGKLNFNIDGKEFGPYDKPEDEYFAKISDKNSLFSYQKEGSWYVDLNGIRRGPYSDVPGNFSLYDNKWGFSYTNEDGKNFATIGGGVFGPSEGDFPDGSYEIGDIKIASKNWIFDYGNEKKNFINVNGKKYGPCDYENVEVSELGWGFSCQIKDDWKFNINGKEFGPYKYKVGGEEAQMLDLSMNDSGWFYKFVRDGKWFFSINGYEYGPYDTVPAEPVLNKNSVMIVYQKEGKNYAKIKSF